MTEIGNNEIFLHCDECGTDTFIGTVEPNDSFQLICPKCNADNGTWGRAKQKLCQDIANIARTSFGKAFEGIEGVKFTASSEDE